MEAMRRKSEALQAMAYLGQASAFLDQAHLGQLLFFYKGQGQWLGEGRERASSLKGVGFEGEERLQV